MKKHELLVPAGDMECLRQAVYHGADAVYLACKNFGARKFATNFSNEEIVEAIHFCHLYGVKLFVTMNTLIRNNEVESFIDQARFLHENGVDALIVQDFGMICLLREKFPNLEIHASTQANNSSLETCRMFYELGVKRVVFSRELSIDEIDSIDVPIEKEAFIHGALCVSYSGCCLMSSMLGGRSGNRGECAGSCRLPYTLMKDNQVLKNECYLLSMKELNTSSEIDRLLNSSVYSFKIEGRMKGPLYVGFITSFYRKLIDGVPMNLEEEINRLKTIFNREFTVGHLFGKEGLTLINSKSPNHIGLEIGKVEVCKDKIRIQLNPNQTLRQYDSIRFLNSNKGMVVNYLYDEKDNLCNSSNGVCYVDNKVELTSSDILMKTQDCLLEKEYIASETVQKIPVSFTVFAKKNFPLKLSITDSHYTFSIEDGEVQKAQSVPTSEEVIYQKLSKLGNTPFLLEHVEFEIEDDIFIPMTLLNDLRRQLAEELMNARMNSNVEVIEKEVSFQKENSLKKSSGFTCLVRTEEQLVTCLKHPFIRIYVESRELYEKYKNNDNVFFFVERCQFSLQDSLKEKNIVSDYMKCESNNVFGSYFLNVTNIYTGYYLQKLGFHNIPLSVELTRDEILEFLSLYQEKFGSSEFEIFGYGRVENMIINSNILGIEDSSYEYKIVDGKNREFPVFFDGCMTHIYNYEKKYMESIPGCVSYFFQFYEENENDICQIVKNFS